MKRVKIFSDADEYELEKQIIKYVIDEIDEFKKRVMESVAYSYANYTNTQHTSELKDTALEDYQRFERWINTIKR